MKCKKCGNEISNGEKFCGKCGTKVEINNSNENISVDKNKIRNVKPAYIVGGVIAVIFIISICVTINNNKSSTITSANNGSSTSTSSTNKLSLNDIQMNTEFTSSSGMNSATQKVTNCALSYLDYFYPNFNWSSMKITLKDGYGRYWVAVNYVKSSASEQGSVAGIMVWIKDINDNNKMGYYTSGSVVQKSNGWGTPLQDNIGE